MAHNGSDFEVVSLSSSPLQDTWSSTRVTQSAIIFELFVSQFVAQQIKLADCLSTDFSYVVDVRDCWEYNFVAWESPESRQKAVKMKKWLKNNTSNLRSRLAHSSGVFPAGDWVRVWLNAVFPQNIRGHYAAITRPYCFFPRPLISFMSIGELPSLQERNNQGTLIFSCYKSNALWLSGIISIPFFIFEKEAVVRALRKKNTGINSKAMKNEIRKRQNKKMHLRFSGEIVPKFDIYLVEVLTWPQPRSYGLCMGMRLA